MLQRINKNLYKNACLSLRIRGRTQDDRGNLALLLALCYITDKIATLYSIPLAITSLYAILF